MVYGRGFDSRRLHHLSASRLGLISRDVAHNDLLAIARAHGVANLEPERYVELTQHADLPDNFWGRGNRIFVPRGTEGLPRIVLEKQKVKPATNATLILNGRKNYSIALWGDGGFLYIAPTAAMREGQIRLADGTISVGPRVRATGRLELNSRNGGSIVLKEDVLIAHDVQILTDDAHALIDAATGKRLNHYGGKIEIGTHVWIGRRATIMGNTSIGDHNVIGACSFVRNEHTPPNVALAGVPAKVVREGVTWRHEDLPSEA
jgi:acetyltransferase-like isoleucine patch superfamily enzyme